MAISRSNCDRRQTRRLHEQPVPLANSRPGRVPPKLQEILDKALAKDPRDRYQKISYFEEDIRSLIRELGTDSLPGLDNSTAPVAPRHLHSGSPVTRALRWLKGTKGSDTVGSISSPRKSRSSSVPDESPITSLTDTERKSVAILPFKNVGNDREIDFYQFSLADAVITELARVRSLVVRPSSVIVKYQNREIDPADAGRELSVDAITATFLRAGDRLRVTAQLLDVRTSEILWSERIDADASDIIAVQDTIVKRIVEGLRLELSPDEVDALAKGSTSDSAASEEYLRGRNCMGQFIYHTIAREDVDMAIEHFRRAIELDQNFALAYSALGGCYVNRVLKGVGQAGDHQKARAAFMKALSIDPKLLEARMHMAFIYLTGGDKPRRVKKLPNFVRSIQTMLVSILYGCACAFGQPVRRGITELCAHGPAESSRSSCGELQPRQDFYVPSRCTKKHYRSWIKVLPGSLNIPFCWFSEHACSITVVKLIQRLEFFNNFSRNTPRSMASDQSSRSV